jgi:3-oxoacyl-[acyl-carrier-protein] synthase II
MGAITPVGLNVDTMWANLCAGVNGIAKITRFDTTGYKAALAAEVKEFDSGAYLEKSERNRTDRYAQYALAAVQEAVDASGMIGQYAPERVGVYFGSGIGGLETLSIEHKKLLEKGPRRVSPYFVPMMISNMASGLIAIKYNCQNAAMPAVTACASGANAIGEALRAIRHGYADAIIAGGAEASITEVGVAGFINMQALTTSGDPDCASLPFDRRRAGFVIGEGAGCLILEEREHALARGAHILAEITGYGSTCDAHHITAPHPEAAGGARAMQDALRESGYTSGEAVYVNAHGTGTPLNDAAETAAIKTALGSAAQDASVSSTKSMTGHMLGAAGAVEAICAILALQNGIVPPTINLFEQDEACDLDCTPLQAKPRALDIALSNSFGFGGHNACLAFRRNNHPEKAVFPDG